MSTMVTRRFFIGGAVSFGALAGCGLLRRPHSFKVGETPRLRFGVVSDVHVRLAMDRVSLFEGYDTTTFERALVWFRDQGVDAVMLCGDMADKGFHEELSAVAAAWWKVFPDDRAPDGRHVERLFVTGNHDWEGWRYQDYGRKIFPDARELDRHKLSLDYVGWWRKAFHEDYARIFRRAVKGYDFVGAQWDGAGYRGSDEIGVRGVPEFFAAHGKSFDPSKPFFFFQHPHPKNTCYGPWAWGHDDGETTRALSPFANAIAFSGHSHYSLTDERSIWQGAFTSVGASSLRYGVMTAEPIGIGGYENSHAPDKTLDRFKLMERIHGSDCRQGMLVSVYDDCVTYARREFLTGDALGDLWVQPLSAADSKPFAFAAHAARCTAPEFPAGAKVTCREIVARTRGPDAKQKAQGVDFPSVEKAALEIAFPAATEAGRVFDYEVSCGGKRKFVVAEGFNFARTNPRARRPMTCVFGKDELSTGCLSVKVTPRNSFFRRGAALHCEIQI